MVRPQQLPADDLVADDLLDSLRDDQLVYFLLNVGDADAQLALLPRDPATGVRRAVIVDAGRTDKVPQLLRALAAEGLIPADEEGRLLQDTLALVVATHPHRDHIAGMAELLEDFGHAVSELWDPGYYHPGPDYLDMMAALEELPHIVYAQPASGLRRFIGDVAVTVLAPSIQLRNRFDTYGVEINDASISLRLEFPSARVVERTQRRTLKTHPHPASLVLGADAQTLSWSYVMTDFPNLPRSDSDAAKAIRAATGRDLLRGQVLKVSHHASKHGVNLELIERIAPELTLVSSVAGAGSYNFPHTVTQEVLREALEPIAGSGAERASTDAQLGLFYTADVDDRGRPLGSIAVVMSPRKRRLWRFGDEPDEPLTLRNARRWKAPLP